MQTEGQTDGQRHRYDEAIFAFRNVAKTSLTTVIYTMRNYVIYLKFIGLVSKAKIVTHLGNRRSKPLMYDPC
jgi:hypothetical protein